MCVIPPPVEPPRQDRPQPHHESWAGLDDINLGDFFEGRIPMLKSFRERFRAREAGEAVAETRAWKLFGMIPHVVAPTERFRVDWQARVDSASGRFCPRKVAGVDCKCLLSGFRGALVFRGEAVERDRRGRAAQGRVERGQVSRGRPELTGATLAPKMREILEELQSKRSQRRV